MDLMLPRSRTLRGRSEDRCDGADSEAEGAKPPVKPGLMLPVLGVLVFPDTSALVSIPGFVYVADLLLAPLMKLGAGGKITHWWDWEPVSRSEIDPEIRPLVVESRVPFAGAAWSYL